MFGKNPPFSYTDPPNLGDKRDPNFDPEHPNFGYNYPPAPPLPPRGCWNDTEPVWLNRPGQPCCPDEQDDCLCITSADTSAWDSVVSTVSANSGTWGGDLNQYSAYWMSTYYDVDANSAKWNSAAELDLTDLSARWEQAYSAVSACRNLIDTYSAQDKLYAKEPIVGDGTVESPFALKDDVVVKLNGAYSLVHDLIVELYGNRNDIIDPNYRQWLTVDSLSGINRDLRFLKVSAAEFQNEVVKLWDALRRILADQGVIDYYEDFNKLYNLIVSTSGLLEQEFGTSATYLYQTIQNNSADLYNAIVSGDADALGRIEALSAHIRENEQKWSEPTYTYAVGMTLENYSTFDAPGTIYYNEE